MRLKKIILNYKFKFIKQPRSTEWLEKHYLHTVFYNLTIFSFFIEYKKKTKILGSIMVL